MIMTTTRDDLLQAAYRSARGADGTTSPRLLAPGRYEERYRVPKWNSRPRACDTSIAFRREIAGQAWTRDEHDRAAAWWHARAGEFAQGWIVCRDLALQAHGDGDGVLISGVYREHFPVDVKDRLRALAHARTAAEDYSLAHWTYGARRTAATWRRRIAGEGATV